MSESIQEAACVVTVKVEGPITVATINRPAKANALSNEVVDALDTMADAVERAAAAGSTRALVITGAGDKAFSAGADISNLVGLTQSESREQMLRGQRVFDRIAKLPVAVIAAINGVAYGGGLELAMACDMRIAAPHARLGQPEITLANIPGWGGTQRLPRLVGRGIASEMILTGAPIDANRALAIGLVNAVAEDPVISATEMALAVAAHSHAAVAAAKATIRSGLRGGIEYGLEVEAGAVAELCQTPEQHDAVTAFLNRKVARS
ncbi:MAG: enoyl-CoA hydratase-related protein [Nakamurella sp.]